MDNSELEIKEFGDAFLAVLGFSTGIPVGLLENELSPTEIQVGRKKTPYQDFFFISRRKKNSEIFLEFFTGFFIRKLFKRKFFSEWRV